MKKTVVLLTVMILLLFLGPQTVFADDYITDAVKGLQTATVYISPEVIGSYGVDNDTAAKLGAMLRSDDNIVLVMLPAKAGEGTDIYSLAKSLSEGLGNQRTIGLAVGKEVIGYAPLLPSGVAADMMHRADSVANDPVTALITFAQNMHSWLATHPQATPTPQPTPTPIPAPLTTQGDQFPWLLAVLGVLFAAIFVAFVVKLRRKIKQNRRASSFRPSAILIRKIQDNVAEIRDRRVRIDLANACLVAQGLLEILQESPKPLGYVEEKFPELIENMDKQVKAFLGHESGRHPVQKETLETLVKILLNYDHLFIELQRGNPESTDLVASIIDSNNAMIQTLGYLPEEK